ncbi:MAG: lipid A deacylase LpxR family protein [Gemmatimonadota bacterium]|nr:lipid A deacylase LpxR family protein [Gemmatimonadota bacterium]
MALSIACIAISPHMLHAQAVPGTLVAGENDALDVWLPQKERPDGEYTNGIRVSLSRATAPLWGRLVRSAAPCTGREARGARCLTTEFAIAQQMYTPEPLSHRASQLIPGAPEDSTISAPIPGDRPFAGWLHADVTANIISEQRLTSLGIVAGITGRESGAEALQKGFHHVIGQVDPPGWRYQLGFFPAASVSYTDHLRYAVTAPDGHDFFDVLPSWSAQLGNARTSAYGELEARIGYHLSHPWSPAARARAGARDFGVWLYGGVRESLVAYDQLLDRSYAKNDTTFSVDRIPWVNSYDFGIAIRRHFLTIAFGGTHVGKEYKTEEVPNHSYGTLTVTVDRGLEP